MVDRRRPIVARAPAELFEFAGEQLDVAAVHIEQM
jgi:hypothetical protein